MTAYNTDFNMMASHVKTIAEAMLIEHFGDRCSGYEADCLCCQRWKLLDDLIANPYEVTKKAKGE